MKATLALVHDTSAPPLTPDKLSDTTGEPRIRDVDLAERLGFDKPAKIRDLIERNAGELRTYGAISATVAETTARGGRPGKVSWLNEGQALVLCALSRTPRAAAVRKQVIDVFLAYRAGRLTPAPASAAAPAPESAGLDALRQDARALAQAATALLARVEAHESGVGPRRAARRLAAEPAATPAAVPALPAPRARRAPAPLPEGGPMLLGVAAIAAHLGITPRQAKYRCDTDALPHFKMGRAVCSTRDALDAFVAASLPAGEARA